MAYPVASMPDGSVKMSDGTFVRPNKKNVKAPVATNKTNLFDFSSVKSPVSSFNIGGDFGTVKPEFIQKAASEHIFSPTATTYAPVATTGAPEEIQPPTDEELKTLLNEGYTEDEIVAAFYPEEKPKETGFIADVKESAQKRLKTGEEITSTDQTGFERFFQEAGQGAGFLGDVAFAGIKSATPEFVKEWLTTAGQSFAGALPESLKEAGISAARSGMDTYAEWRKNNPRAALNLEASVNIGSLLPIGKGVQVAAPVIGKKASGVASAVTAPVRGTKKILTRDFPVATVMNDLKMTPTERKTIEKITGKNAAEYVLGKNLGASSKEELASVFDQQAINAYKAVNEKLGKVNVRVKSEPAKEAIQDIIEQMESSPKLKRAYADDIAYLKTLEAQADYSPVELNNLRRAFDKVNTGMFTASGKMRSGLEADVDVRIREALSDEIEKAAKSAGFSVKEINNELRAGLTMKDAMLRSLSQEQKNNLVWLQDIGIMGVFSGGDPGTAIALGIAKRGFEGIRPKLAQKFYNMNKAPSAPLPAARGNTIPARNKSGLIARPDSVPPVPAKVAAPFPKVGNAGKSKLLNNADQSKINQPNADAPKGKWLLSRIGDILPKPVPLKWGLRNKGGMTTLLPGTGKVDGVLDNSSKEVRELMFHTSSAPIGELKPWKILWTGTSDYSNRYGKTGSKFKYSIDPQKIKILDSYSESGRKILDRINASLKNEDRFSGWITNDDGGVSSFFIQNKSVIQKLKELGFDAVKTSESNYSNTPSIGIINPEKIKIRNVSQ